jgi:hypothetical protein
MGVVFQFVYPFKFSGYQMSVVHMRV